MTKPELLKNVAALADCTQSQAESVLNAFADTIEKEIFINGQSLAYPGLGTFKGVTRDARIGRNPATGQSISIGASKKVVFKPSPTLIHKY